MREGLIHVLTVEERLDAGNVQDLKSGLNTLLENGGIGIIVDFSRTRFIDSIGLGALVSVLKSASLHDMKIALCSLSPQVRQIFELTRLYRLLDIFEDAEDAKAAMRL